MAEARFPGEPGGSPPFPEKPHSTTTKEMERARSAVQDDLHIQVGDVIEIKAPKNPAIHEKWYFVESLVPQKMSFVDIIHDPLGQNPWVVSHESFYGMQKMESMVIRWRPPEQKQSYAAQRNYVPGSRVELVFRAESGEGAGTVTGTILKLDADNDQIVLQLDKSAGIFSGRNLAITFNFQGFPVDSVISDLLLLTTSLSPPPSSGDGEGSVVDRTPRSSEGISSGDLTEEIVLDPSVLLDSRFTQSSTNSVEGDGQEGDEYGPNGEVPSRLREYSLDEQLSDLFLSISKSEEFAEQLEIAASIGVGARSRVFRELNRELDRFSALYLWRNFIIEREGEEIDSRPASTYLWKSWANVSWVVPVILGRLNQPTPVFEKEDHDDYPIFSENASALELPSWKVLDQQGFNILLWQRPLQFEKNNKEREPVRMSVLVRDPQPPMVLSEKKVSIAGEENTYSLWTSTDEDVLYIHGFVVLPVSAIQASRVSVPHATLDIKSRLNLQKYQLWRAMPSFHHLSSVPARPLVPGSGMDWRGMQWLGWDGRRIGTMFEVAEKEQDIEDEEEGDNASSRANIPTDAEALGAISHMFPTTSQLLDRLDAAFDPRRTPLSALMNVARMDWRNITFYDLVRRVMSPYHVSERHVSDADFKKVNSVLRRAIKGFSHHARVWGSLLQKTMSASLSSSSSSPYSKKKDNNDDDDDDDDDGNAEEVDVRTQELAWHLSVDGGQWWYEKLRHKSVVSDDLQSRADVLRAFDTRDYLNQPPESCFYRKLVKRYGSVAEMEREAENARRFSAGVVYVDSEFDTTPYSLKETLAAVTTGDGRQEKENQESLETKMVRELETKYGHSHQSAIRVAQYIISGRRPVQEGEYAVIAGAENRMTYYVWTRFLPTSEGGPRSLDAGDKSPRPSNGEFRWVQDDSVDEFSFLTICHAMLQTTMSVRRHRRRPQNEDEDEDKDDEEVEEVDDLAAVKARMRDVFLARIISAFDRERPLANEKTKELSRKREHRAARGFANRLEFRVDEFRKQSTAAAVVVVDGKRESPEQEIWGENDIEEERNSLLRQLYVRGVTDSETLELLREFAIRTCRPAILAEKEDPAWYYGRQSGSGPILPRFLTTLADISAQTRQRDPSAVVRFLESPSTRRLLFVDGHRIGIRKVGLPLCDRVRVVLEDHSVDHVSANNTRRDVPSSEPRSQRKMDPERAAFVDSLNAELDVPLFRRKELREFVDRYAPECLSLIDPIESKKSKAFQRTSTVVVLAALYALALPITGTWKDLTRRRAALALECPYPPSFQFLLARGMSATAPNAGDDGDAAAVAREKTVAASNVAQVDADVVNFHACLLNRIRRQEQPYARGLWRGTARRISQTALATLLKAYLKIILKRHDHLLHKLRMVENSGKGGEEKRPSVSTTIASITKKGWFHVRPPFFLSAATENVYPQVAESAAAAAAMRDAYSIPDPTKEDSDDENDADGPSILDGRARARLRAHERILSAQIAQYAFKFYRVLNILVQSQPLLLSTGEMENSCCMVGVTNQRGTTFDFFAEQNQVLRECNEAIASRARKMDGAACVYAKLAHPSMIISLRSSSLYIQRTSGSSSPVPNLLVATQEQAQYMYFYRYAHARHHRFRPPILSALETVGGMRTLQKDIATYAPHLLEPMLREELVRMMREKYEIQITEKSYTQLVRAVHLQNAVLRSAELSPATATEESIRETMHRLLDVPPDMAAGNEEEEETETNDPDLAAALRFARRAEAVLHEIGEELYPAEAEKEYFLSSMRQLFVDWNTDAAASAGASFYRAAVDAMVALAEKADMSDLSPREFRRRFAAAANISLPQCLADILVVSKFRLRNIYFYGVFLWLLRQYLHVANAPDEVEDKKRNDRPFMCVRDMIQELLTLKNDLFDN